MPLAIPKSGGIRPYNTTVAEHNGVTTVTLYRTQIATYDRNAKTVKLHTGGYATPTTIRRMNECLHAWGLSTRVRKSDFDVSDVRCYKVVSAGREQGTPYLEPVQFALS